MAMIKGISVILHEKVKTGEDPFRAPIYKEHPVTVKNVLVSPVSSEDIAEGLQLYGKRAVYELSIPKGDNHAWEDRRVDFFGQSFHTFGFVTEHIQELVPLDWNKKVKVERYG